MITIDLTGISLEPDIKGISAAFEEHSAPTALATTLMKTLKSANYTESDIRKTCIGMLELIEEEEGH